MSDGMGWTFITLGRAAVAAAFGGGILIGTLHGHAEDPSSRNSGNPTTGTSEEGFWSRWLNKVSRTQAEQPHWITPLVIGPETSTEADTVRSLKGYAIRLRKSEGYERVA